MNDLIIEDGSGEPRTEDDRDYRSDGVQMHCRGWYLAKYGIDMQKQKDETPMCRIIRKLGKGDYGSGGDENDFYLVRIVDWEDNDEDRVWEYSSKDSDVVWGVPRDAFFFKDLPYTRDIHQEWAFRHPMMIPDEIFPEVWKNSIGDEDRSYLQFVEQPFVKKVPDEEEGEDKIRETDDDDDDDREHENENDDDDFEEDTNDGGTDTDDFEEDSEDDDVTENDDKDWEYSFADMEDDALAENE